MFPPFGVLLLSLYFSFWILLFLNSIYEFLWINSHGTPCGYCHKLDMGELILSCWSMGRRLTSRPSSNSGTRNNLHSAQALNSTGAYIHSSRKKYWMTFATYWWFLWLWEIAIPRYQIWGICCLFLPGIIWLLFRDISFNLGDLNFKKLYKNVILMKRNCWYQLKIYCVPTTALENFIPSVLLEINRSVFLS